MSDFEFALVGVSMILAAALVRSIEGAYALWRSPRRSWLAALFLYHTLAYAITYFVTLLDDVQNETSAALVVVSMTQASLHFLRSHVIATSEPAGIEDWKSQARAVAREFFVVTLALNVANAIGVVIAGEAPVTSPPMLSFYLGIAVNGVGAISKNPRVHVVVAITMTILITLAALGVTTAELRR